MSSSGTSLQKICCYLMCVEYGDRHASLTVRSAFRLMVNLAGWSFTWSVENCTQISLEVRQSPPVNPTRRILLHCTDPVKCGESNSFYTRIAHVCERVCAYMWERVCVCVSGVKEERGRFLILECICDHCPIPPSLFSNSNKRMDFNARGPSRFFDLSAQARRSIHCPTS